MATTSFFTASHAYREIISDLLSIGGVADQISFIVISSASSRLLVLIWMGQVIFLPERGSLVNQRRAGDDSWQKAKYVMVNFHLGLNCGLILTPSARNC
jgi:hypothetical protein